jgi:hypothetical protein
MIVVWTETAILAELPVPSEIVTEQRPGAIAVTTNCDAPFTATVATVESEETALYVPVKPDSEAVIVVAFPGPIERLAGETDKPVGEGLGIGTAFVDGPLHDPIKIQQARSSNVLIDTNLSIARL